MAQHAIPRTVNGRLLKRGGAQRASPDAKDALAALLEEHAAHVVHEAVRIAHMEGRTTVRGIDIERARTTVDPRPPTH